MGVGGWGDVGGGSFKGGRGGGGEAERLESLRGVGGAGCDAIRK